MRADKAHGGPCRPIVVAETSDIVIHIPGDFPHDGARCAPLRAPHACLHTALRAPHACLHTALLAPHACLDTALLAHQACSGCASEDCPRPMHVYTLRCSPATPRSGCVNCLRGTGRAAGVKTTCTAAASAKRLSTRCWTSPEVYGQCAWPVHAPLGSAVRVHW